MPMDSNKLLVLGGIGIGAYIFRNQLSQWLGLGGAQTIVNPVGAAQSAAASAAAAGATPAQQAQIAQNAATVAAAQQAQQISLPAVQPVASGTDIGVSTAGPNTLLAKAAGGDMPTALSLQNDPRAQLNLYQWNWFRCQWNPSAVGVDASRLNVDASAAVGPVTYLNYLSRYLSLGVPAVSSCGG